MIEARIEGRRLRGFESGEVKMSLDRVPATFSLEYFERADTAGRSDPRILHAGDRVTLTAEGEDLVDGYVDSSKVQYSASSRSYSISGRSVTADLSDCSAMPSPGDVRIVQSRANHLSQAAQAAAADGRAEEAQRLQRQSSRLAAGAQRGSYLNVDLAQIATKLLDPFDVDVITASDVGAKFRRFKLQPGETVLGAIRRAARMRGFVLYTVGGSLVIERAGDSSTSTVLRRGGTRILDATRTTDHSQRFSEYHFCGQTRATDDVNGVSAAQLNGSVFDPQVRRHRPILVTKEGADGNADMGERAVHERNRRAGMSERVSYTLRGWLTEDGFLWRPNILVEVRDDWLGVMGNLIVSSVTYRFGPAEPRTVQLELTRPEAYDQEEFPAIGRGDLWRA